MHSADCARMLIAEPPLHPHPGAAQPPVKPLPSRDISPHMAGLRSEDDLSAFIQSSKPGTAVVEFGTSWCHKCHEMFPTFYKLSKQVRERACCNGCLAMGHPPQQMAAGPPHMYPLCTGNVAPACPLLLLQFSQHKYGVAQVEHMPKIVGQIRFTPTFAIYRGGQKVDEVVGNEPQRLADHLWLQSD